MNRFEYMVIPAATRGEKAKGLKTPGDRFAHALAAQINKLAAEGWDYLRAETLPSEERSGLAGRSVVYHNMLVFRRPVQPLADDPKQQPAARPQPEYPVAASPAQSPEKTPELPQAAAPQPAPDAPPAGGDTPATPPSPREKPAPDQAR